MNNIYKIDLVLVVVSLVVLMGTIGYVSPRVISPLDDYETTETEILFSIEKADEILIDDNLEFSSPERYATGDGVEIDLEPGQYYWKANGVLDSKIMVLVINSEVNLELKLNGEDYNVVNIGNVKLNLDIYNGTDLINEVDLNIGDDVDVSGDKFVGGLDE